MTPRSANLAHGPAAAFARAVPWLIAAMVTAAMAGTALAQADVKASPAPAFGAASGQPIATSPAPPQPQPPASSSSILPPQPPPASPTDQRGFLNGFGNWWNQSVADFKAKMNEQKTEIDEINKQSADAAKDAATATQQAMKNAADAMRPSHVIEIQQTCPVAGNGAADCATAATTVCKTKGFKTGQPLDVRTAEKCADSLWVSGQNPTPAECPVETVLLRAACQ